ncbi:zinc finger protein 33A-like [Centruroides sculpturatus]|uniref:zinc finger protein 33A-like n=1 Tax=Centruroides sculpturatus TaxID=218467 RepID=UPI000C6D3121|nr:zinc finger protein 33A-like [Centruroides sculpturatus]
MQLEKDQTKIHECTFCENKFRTKWELEVHMRSHTGEKPFECNICGKKFSQSGNLLVHKKIHFEERPFKCNYKDCTYTAKRKDVLIEHVNRTHLKISPKKPEKVHKCHKCDKSFEWLSTLTLHLTSHGKKRRFLCEICKKTFKHKYHLTRHMKIVHPQKQTESFSTATVEYIQDVEYDIVEKKQKESMEKPSMSDKKSQSVEYEEAVVETLSISSENTEIMNRDEYLNMNELEDLPELEIFSEVIIEGIELECHVCEEKFDNEVARREHEAKFH